MYVGTYARTPEQGIPWLTLDLATGKLEPKGVLGGIRSPSFLAVHPSLRFLYSVNEISDFEGKPAGGVSAYSIDPKTGALTLLNQQPSTGSGPCHLVVDKAGKNVLVANYGGGNVACLPLGKDGRLSAATASSKHALPGDTDKPRRALAHSINVSPGGGFAAAADAGLDRVFVYTLDVAKGGLASAGAAVLPVGAAPRHFAFHPGGRFAYVINESAMSVTAFAWDEKKGTLTSLQTIDTLPRPKQAGDSTAEVQVHPSGKFLYGSNRGHDSIAVFAIDQATGKLTAVQNQPTLGKTPRNFGLDPTGQYLIAANQSSGDMHTFRINAATGKLSPTGHSIKITQPVCVKFLPFPIPQAQD